MRYHFRDIPPVRHQRIELWTWRLKAPYSTSWVNDADHLPDRIWTCDANLSFRLKVECPKPTRRLGVILSLFSAFRLAFSFHIWISLFRFDMFLNTYRWIWTIDIRRMKTTLCQLSYIGISGKNRTWTCADAGLQPTDLPTDLSSRNANGTTWTFDLTLIRRIF